ncbi:hypothetical protein Ajs_0565 [Acidovorax sp. JS42]|nr:hypothetical protein Ajs_0565 [Acidovorax sp. JS42]
MSSVLVVSTFFLEQPLETIAVQRDPGQQAGKHGHRCRGLQQLRRPELQGHLPAAARQWAVAVHQSGGVFVNTHVMSFLSKMA